MSLYSTVKQKLPYVETSNEYSNLFIERSVSLYTLVPAQIHATVSLFNQLFLSSCNYFSFHEPISLFRVKAISLHDLDIFCQSSTGYHTLDTIIPFSSAGISETDTEITSSAKFWRRYSVQVYFWGYLGFQPKLYNVNGIHILISSAFNFRVFRILKAFRRDLNTRNWSWSRSSFLLHLSVVSSLG